MAHLIIISTKTDSAIIMQASRTINGGAFMLFALATAFLLNYTHTKIQLTEIAVQDTINQPASVPEKASKPQRQDIGSLHNLFGVAPQKDELVTKNKHIKVMQHGPKTLEGIFIERSDNTQQAWALVTNQKGEFSIIPPNQILSFTSASISIKTQQGLKSLHLTKDEQGIDIRKMRNKQVAGLNKKSGIKKPELSRAEKLRKKMLGK